MGENGVGYLKTTALRFSARRAERPSCRPMIVLFTATKWSTANEHQFPFGVDDVHVEFSRVMRFEVEFEAEFPTKYRALSLASSSS